MIRATLNWFQKRHHAAILKCRQAQHAKRLLRQYYGECALPPWRFMYDIDAEVAFRKAHLLSWLAKQPGGGRLQ